MSSEEAELSCSKASEAQDAAESSQTSTRQKFALGSSSSRWSQGWDSIRRTRRTEQRPSTLDKKLLLFWPWFVECAFQKHYHSSTLSLVDSFCIPVSTLIFFSDLVFAVMDRNYWKAAAILPGLALEFWCLAYRYRYPEKYAKRRLTITTIRRLAILPVLSMFVIRNPALVHTDSRGKAALVLLVVASGSLHNFAATFLFFSSWWNTIAELAVGTALLATAAPSSCRNLLAGPVPNAGWPTAAALMDKAALGIYKRSLGQPDMAHAVCCSTLNTTLVLVSCLAGYLMHWYERCQRLRFKQQIPPAVAAMQPHLYGLPTGLIAAQAVLLVLYPAMVISWAVFGAWYRLWGASSV